MPSARPSPPRRARYRRRPSASPSARTMMDARIHARSGTPSGAGVAARSSIGAVYRDRARRARRGPRRIAHATAAAPSASASARHDAPPAIRALTFFCASRAWKCGQSGDRHRPPQTSPSASPSAPTRSHRASPASSVGHAGRPPESSSATSNASPIVWADVSPHSREYPVRHSLSCSAGVRVVLATTTGTPAARASWTSRSAASRTSARSPSSEATGHPAGARCQTSTPLCRPPPRDG